MIREDVMICPICEGALRYYDSVRRIVRTKYGKTDFVLIRRMRCCECNSFHREIPEFIFPYKHYEKEIIIGVVEGLITYNTIGFEDYPSELTMARWIRTIDISLLS
jgi:hypothetical protein